MEQLSKRETPTVGPAVLAAWKLPPIVGAIAVSIVGGFYVGGPGLGMAVGALAATSIIVMAVRCPPPYPIIPAPLRDFRRHLLVVVSEPLEDPVAIEQIVGATRGGDDRLEAEVVVLTPIRHGFLNRWTSDFDSARQRAQDCLVVSIASLAKAGIVAAPRMGDEDLVQAVEDELRDFPATDVILVTGTPSRSSGSSAAALELAERLRAEFHHVVLGPRARPRRRSTAPAQRPVAARSRRAVQGS